MQRSLVVSALGYCTAAPGSNPARHPTLGPAGMKYLPRRYPAQEDTQQAKSISRMNIVLM